jgi:ribonuclease P protein component
VRRGEFDAVYRAGKRRSSSQFTVLFRANELLQIHPKSSVARAPFAALTAGLLRLLKSV